MGITEGQKKRLQKVENGVYRKILGARDHAPLVTLRGEIGASKMESRLMQDRIMLTKSILGGRNELVKEVLRKMRGDRENGWNMKLNQYLREIGLEYGDIVRTSGREIKKRVRRLDTEKWERELESKETLGLYRKYKGIIKEERIYDNRYSSELLYGARANALGLNDWKRHQGGSMRCDLCGCEREVLIHFLMECEKLENRRDRTFLRGLGGEANEDTVGKALFETEGEDLERVKRMIQDLWFTRKAMIGNKKADNNSLGGSP